MEDIAVATAAFIREHKGWAVPMAFAAAFGESICFVSLFWPGTLILAATTGALSAAGLEASYLWPMIIAAAAGGSSGYALSYWVGWIFKDSLHKVWPFSARPDLIPRGRRFFERYGASGVFIGHFFGPVRAVIPVAAGMFAMRQLPFQVANVTSAVLWAAGVIAPSYFAVSFKDSILVFLREHEALTVILLFLFAAANSIPTPSLFAPSLLLFAGLGALHLFAGGSFLPAWLAGAAGAFAGDICLYHLGALRQAAVSGSLPPAKAGRMQGARALIERTGAASLITSKFLGMRRAEIPPMAGAMEVPPAEFIIASLISAFLWALVLLAPRYMILLLLGV